jgi:acetyl-CoA carboxylase beta subunit
MSGRRRLAAVELIEATVDPGSWISWDLPVDLSGAGEGYRTNLEEARRKAGTDEAVLTGRARIRGHHVALIVSEFRFLGGSIGRATSERIEAAVRRATVERLPLVAAPSSGGTRMQEGTPAFVTMVDISRAVVAHKAAGLLYVVYLRHPTTGGVLASWGSLGHLTLAEPEALIGFLGPAVYQALHQQPFPSGVQVAENLVARGVVDAVVEPENLADILARVLDLLYSLREDHLNPTTAGRPRPDPDAWAAIELTRRPDRPGLQELLRHAAADVVYLEGTERGGSGGPLLIALTAFRGVSCVLIGQDRSKQRAGALLGPAALRTARRGMVIAEQLRQPVVCVIDTPGAELSAAAEEGALAGEIARCLAALVQLTVPSVSILLGEGCGGAALALLPTRRVIAAENAWLSPLPPEGASVIMHRTADRAPEMARMQRIRACDLLEAGLVHAVVPEHPTAVEDPLGFMNRIADETARQIRAQRPIGSDVGSFV